LSIEDAIAGAIPSPATSITIMPVAVLLVLLVTVATTAV
jgi:hypothetical protein